MRCGIICRAARTNCSAARVSAKSLQDSVSTRKIKQDDHNTSMNSTAPATTALPTNTHDVLWVDGVGGFLLCTGQHVVVGSGAEADIAIRGNLSREHIRLTQANHDEHWSITAWRPTSLQRESVANGVSPSEWCPLPIDQPVALHDGDRLQLAGDVELTFRQPTLLSRSALLSLSSSHRWAAGIDGVVLFRDDCLIGPGGRTHIRSRKVKDPVVLFQRDGEYLCHQLSERHNRRLQPTVTGGGQSMKANHSTGQHVSSEPIRPGSVISAGGLRFRIESPA